MDHEIRLETHTETDLETCEIQTMHVRTIDIRCREGHL